MLKFVLDKIRKIFRNPPELSTGAPSAFEKAMADVAFRYPPNGYFEEVRQKNALARQVPVARFRFAFSIANEVINVWGVNRKVANPVDAKSMIDSFHGEFLARQDRHIVRVTDYVVIPEELETVRMELARAGINGDIDWAHFSTTWADLIEMVYLIRQIEYVSLLDLAASSKLQHVRATTELAFALTHHLTGKTIDTHDTRDSFINFAGALDSALFHYWSRIKEGLPAS